MTMQYSIEPCNLFKDSRGVLVEFINEFDLEKSNLPFGQIYYLSFEGKGVVRGNHYHLHSSEVFCVMYGEVEIVIEDVETKERVSKVIKANDEQVFRIYIGPKVAHAIKSLSDFAMLVSYSSTIYNAEDEDKYFYEVSA
jgi:dTDP-4-dehydrorhamnose 3,5-epimerase-like enzyme